MIKLIIKVFEVFFEFIKHLYIRFRILTEKGNCKLSLLKKIKACLRGFKGDQWVWYNLDHNDITEFVSEYEYYLTKDINNQYHLIMDDKFIFSEIFGKYINVPNVFFYIYDGKIYSRNSKQCSFEDLIEILIKEENLIVKPVNGARGENVHILTINQELSGKKSSQGDLLFYLDNELKEKDQLKKFISQLNEFIITEFIKQHKYAKKLYNKTTNTIRVITIQDPENSNWIIPNAIHRIGTNKSFPVDNFSNGGLTAEIDLETGILGKVFDPTNCDHTKSYMRKHPDTGVRITGVKIPFWEDLKETLLNISSKFPYVYFIAWDVVITNQGFSIVEINNSSGLNIFQVFGGVRNGKLGKFYKHHGVVK
mgnify:CR=1 FL=1